MENKSIVVGCRCEHVRCTDVTMTGTTYHMFDVHDRLFSFNFTLRNVSFFEIRSIDRASRTIDRSLCTL